MDDASHRYRQVVVVVVGLFCFVWTWVGSCERCLLGPQTSQKSVDSRTFVFLAAKNNCMSTSTISIYCRRDACSMTQVRVRCSFPLQPERTTPELNVSLLFCFLFSTLLVASFGIHELSQGPYMASALLWPINSDVLTWFSVFRLIHRSNKFQESVISRIKSVNLTNNTVLPKDILLFGLLIVEVEGAVKHVGRESVCISLSLVSISVFHSSKFIQVQ